MAADLDRRRRERRSRRRGRHAPDERDLVRAAKAGDRDARQRLVADHVGLVKRTASRYRDMGLPIDDLVQEGSIGLLDAIERFDASRSPDFRAFARFRIRRAIQNALTHEARLVRCPKHVLERRRAVARTEAHFIAANGRAPSAAELAAATGLSVDSVIDAREPGPTFASLDEPYSADGSNLYAILADPSGHDPGLEAIAAEERRRVGSAVERLAARERKIITHRYGLGVESKPLAEIANDLRLSQRRTRTIESKALRDLREDLEAVLTG